MPSVDDVVAKLQALKAKGPTFSELAPVQAELDTLDAARFVGGPAAAAAHPDLAKIDEAYGERGWGGYHGAGAAGAPRYGQTLVAAAGCGAHGFPESWAIASANGFGWARAAGGGGRIECSVERRTSSARRPAAPTSSHPTPPRTRTPSHPDLLADLLDHAEETSAEVKPIVRKLAGIKKGLDRLAHAKHGHTEQEVARYQGEPRLGRGVWAGAGGSRQLRGLATAELSAARSPPPTLPSRPCPRHAGRHRLCTHRRRLWGHPGISARRPGRRSRPA